ncbi:MAG: galactokinase, partial [Phycisphaerae bacterium]
IVAAGIIDQAPDVVNPAQLAQRFSRVFDGARATAIVRAPGRVNIIGEHTDYNEGFVLPIAIRQATWVAASARRDRTLRVYSTAFDQLVELDLASIARSGPGPSWSRYVRGLAASLLEAGVNLVGANVLIDSDLPIGAGLSSSAALEVGLARALLDICGGLLETVELALLCQRAEHLYAGVPCGIMDQFASLLARPGCALLLDCRSREYEHVPVDHAGLRFVIIDTQVRHELAQGQYAIRQQQCRAGVDYFARLEPSVRALRDVSEQMVQGHLWQLDPTVAARCAHVVSENRRVLEVVEAFKRGQLEQVGRLLVESHHSLRDQYQVSCRQLDELVQIATATPGIYGARMTGGGFGGCVLVLAETGALGPLRQAIRQRYDPLHDRPARIFQTEAAGGADYYPLQPDQETPP